MGQPLAFAKVPLSARMQGAAGLVPGGHDLFESFSNPALATRQSRTWEVGLADALMFGGDQNVWAVGAGWAGSQEGTVGWAAAAQVSGWNMSAFDEIDLYGNRTGTRVTPGGFHGGAAGAFRWKKWSVGLGVRFASAALDGLPDAVPSLAAIPLADFAFARTGEHWDFEMGWRGMGPQGSPEEFILTLLRHGEAPWRVTWGGGFSTPGDTASKTHGGGFIGWSFFDVVEPRLGLYGSGDTEARLTAGMTATWAGYALDYAIGLSIVGSNLGAMHHIVLRRSFGAFHTAPSPAGT